jgi:LmbE family N-acetylglucosaminyl deacetylase
LSAPRSCGSARTAASSTAVADKLKSINASLPPDVVVQPVLNRTELVNSTIKTVVAKNLSEGAVLVIVVLFLAARQFPRGADRGARHPDHHDADRLRDAACRRLGQPDEPWRWTSV